MEPTPDPALYTHGIARRASELRSYTRQIVGRASDPALYTLEFVGPTLDPGLCTDKIAPRAPELPPYILEFARRAPDPGLCRRKMMERPLDEQPLSFQTSRPALVLGFSKPPTPWAASIRGAHALRVPPALHAASTNRAGAGGAPALQLLTLRATGDYLRDRRYFACFEWVFPLQLAT